MARWAPGARGRLQAAAFELFTEKGYDETTVGDIATRAGVTERTFYRYFADRREVFFDGSRDLQDYLVHTVEAVPADVAPLDAVVGALCQAATGIFATRSTLARQRQRLIDANPELHERELAKMSRLAAALIGGAPLSGGRAARRERRRRNRHRPVSGGVRPMGRRTQHHQPRAAHHQRRP